MMTVVESQLTETLSESDNLNVNMMTSETNIRHQSAPSNTIFSMPTSPPLSFMETSAITLLLSDHEKFGFSERAFYHFDLIEILTSIPQNPKVSILRDDKVKCGVQNIDNTRKGRKLESISKRNFMEIIGEENKSDDQGNPLSSNGIKATMDPHPQPTKCCGVVALLECTSTQTRQKFKRRRLLKRIKDFNRRARDIYSSSRDYCYQPQKLPIHLPFNTRMAFIYEMTRMVFCIDASPSLTATFGNLGTLQQLNDDAICAMDRLDKMVRMFFDGLVQPIVGVNVTREANSEKFSETEDHSKSWWTPMIAVTVIAVYPRTTVSSDVETFKVLVQDYRLHDEPSSSILSDRISDWVVSEVESGIAARLSRTGSNLNSSCSSLRHILNIADVALGTLPSEGRPCIVLATDCRRIECDGILDLVRDQNLLDKPLHILDLSGSKSHQTTANCSGMAKSMDELSSPSLNEPNYLMLDHDGPSTFPLCFPDDSEALYQVCKALRGCFFDFILLRYALSTFAGKATVDSPFHNDTYFSKERKLKTNALQWYTLFSLSPCCPRPNPLGEMPPPEYIQAKRQKSVQKTSQSRTMFLNYALSPIRVKGVIVMRIMDGYRLRRYGYNSQEADKVSIHFTLSLELGTTIHYELSFVAFPNYNPMVGNAHVKISLSGNSSFVQSARNEFISHQFNVKKPIRSVRQKACDKICRFLNFTKTEDLLECKLCPLEWGDSLTEGSLFLNHLSELSSYQRYRHFRMERPFEVAITGKGLSEFKLGIGERQLYEAIKAWSSYTIKEQYIYIKELPTAEGNLISYCLIEVTKSIVERIFTVQLLFFEQVHTNTRLDVVGSLKMLLLSCRELVLAPQMISKNIVSRSRQNLVETMYHHERWELLFDEEIFALLCKRRSQFGNFFLVKHDNSSAIFIKFVRDEEGRSCLVQYHIRALPNQVIVEMFMDCLRGEFCMMELNSCTYSSGLRPPSLFTKIYEKVKNRDQKCGRALRSRRNLLRVFEENILDNYPGDQRDDVERLLAHSSRSSKRLRFFDNSSRQANRELAVLTIQLFSSEMFDTNVVKLCINDDISVGSMAPGTWFLLRHDSHMLTFIHFPSQEFFSETGDSNAMYRELTFFTVSIGGLYYTQDDIADDDSTEGVEAEYECVTHVADAMEKAHALNYALSAYLALRHYSSDATFSFTASDFAHVLNQCVNFKITQGVNVTKKDGLKLAALITGIELSPVPGGGPCFFFDGNQESVMHIPSCNSREKVIGNDLMSMSSGIYENEEDCDSLERDSSDTTPPYNTNQLDLKHIPPLFMIFLLDDKPASLQDIKTLQQNCTLNAYITIFDEWRYDMKQIEFSPLPHAHATVATKLVSRLNSFRAEQTLENLRSEGITLSNIDIETVKKCLLEAENVASTTASIHFYIATTDSILDASILAVVKGGVHCQLSLLCLSIANQQAMPMKRISALEFFASDTKESGWCYINVSKEASIHVYHPSGKNRAEKIAVKVRKLVGDLCHRVNQKLLLENLHKTRTANSLLIPAVDTLESPSSSAVVDDTLSDHDYYVKHSNVLDYTPGFFQCPLSYKKSYYLNRRCSIAQAFIALKSSVLHNFAVSNRRGYFVYKEEDLIYYMKLGSRQGIDGEKDSVELFVFGEQEAGPLITEQLNRLIEKKIMAITLMAISSVLTKNCRYNLWETDISFLHSFQKAWRMLENEKMQTDVRCEDERFYEFPSSVNDPVILLLYFRQNISGSTFFHILNEAPTENNNSHARVTDSKVPSTGKTDTDPSNGIFYSYKSSDFSLCYNASQFQLDPNFQAISTITKAGTSFAQQAGTGIALIEIKLLNFTNEEVNKVSIGLRTPEEIEPLQIPLKFLRFLEISDKDGYENVSKFRLSVRVINTTLKADVLHKWIELTLNQAVSSWVIERHIERARLRLFIKEEKPEKKDHVAKDLSEVSSRYLGLPGFCSILHSSNHLPHPAVQRLQFESSVRATVLAKMTFNFLERGLIQPLFDKRLRVSDVSGLDVFRFCGKDIPKVVRFSCENHQNTVQVYDAINNSLIFDDPSDSPEYIAVFGLRQETGNMQKFDLEKRRKPQLASSPPPSSFLFRSVFVEDHLGDGRSDSLSSAIIKLVSSSPHAFLRSVAFVIRMTKSSQSVLFYNWNPQTKQSAETRLKEVHGDFLLSHNVKIISLQSTCLKNVGLFQSLSTQPSGSEVGYKINNSILATILKRSPSDRSLQPKCAPMRSSKKGKNAPQEKSRTAILMPTIVGKSVKGSDTHMLAMARARARASAPRVLNGGRFKAPSTNNNGNIHNQKSHIHKTREKSLPKPKVPNLMENIPSSLVKEYRILQGHLSSLTLLRNTAIRMNQNLFLHRMTNLKRKELTFESMEFILTHGNLLKAEVFPLIQSAVVNPTPFILYLNKNISMSEGIILSKNLTNHISQTPKTMYTINRIVTSKYYTAYLIHDISIFKHPSKDLICRCRSWFFASSKINDITWIKEKGSKRKNILSKREKESLMMNIVSSVALRYLNLSSAMFNFVSILLRRIAKQQEIKMSFSNVPLLLRESMKVFPQWKQIRMSQLWYRLIHRKMVCRKSDLLMKGSWFSMQKLIDYICLKQAIYNVVNCSSKDQHCFSGLAPGKDMHYFLNIQDENQDVFFLDIYVLCSRVLGTIEAYIFKDGSPHAKKLSQHILDITQKHIIGLLGKTVIDLRRDLLWEKYSCVENMKNEEASDDVSSDVFEMLSLSSLVPIAKLDPRLMELMTDEANSLDINWSEAFSSMVNDPVFSLNRCFYISKDKVQTTIYLVYFQEENLFLMLELNETLNFKSASIISKRKVTEGAERSQKIVKIFAHWLLFWMWNNT